MFFYEELIRKREARDQKLEEAADQLLMESVPTSSVDALSSVEAALGMILSAFSVPYKKVLGCVNEQELIEATLDGAGIMSEAVDLSDRSILRRSEWILAQTEDGRAVVLKPSLFGYVCVDAELKKSCRLSRKICLRPEGYVIHRPILSDEGSVRGILRLILQLVTARDILSVLVCAAVIALLGMAIPALNAWALNTLLPRGSQAYGALVYGVVLFISVGIFQSALKAAKMNALSNMRMRISMQVQSALMAKLLLQPYSHFADASAGRVARKIHSGHQLAEKIINVFLDTSFTLLFSLVYIPQMLRYGPEMCVPALLVLLVKILLSVFFFISCARNNEALLENDMESNSFLYLVIRGIQKIKSVNAEARVYAKWASMYRKRIRLNLDPPVIMKLRNVLISFLSSFCVVLLLAVAARSGVSREDYIAFNAAYALVAASVSQLIDVMESIFLMGPLVRQVDSLLDTGLPEEGSRHYVRFLKGRITLENVSFSYPDGAKSSVNDVSLNIRPNEKIAIVGESGSGKSTLLKLMLGLEQADAGSISYDGHNLNSLDQRSLRKRIGTVMQFSRVIPGTLYENIAFGCAAPVSMEQAWEAAEKAAIADDIRKLKLGMDTEISESGTGGFSGGQRQRLLLARALVSKPSVLLLDEATSALDNITQKRVLEAVYRERATVIMVAHRLSTIVACDRIVMLENGCIAEQGRYEELMALNGKFARLVKKQQEESGGFK